MLWSTNKRRQQSAQQKLSSSTIVQVLKRFVRGINSATTLDSRQRRAGTTLIRSVVERRYLEALLSDVN